MSESYKKVSPIKSDYEPLGTIEKISDLDVYVAKPKDKSKPFKKAVIVCYDIFGFHPNVKQYCDLLAEAGFLTVLPDYQRGQAWSKERISSEG
jgi:dienelactone hydrolase